MIFGLFKRSTYPLMGSLLMGLSFQDHFQIVAFFQVLWNLKRLAWKRITFNWSKCDQNFWFRLFREICKPFLRKRIRTLLPVQKKNFGKSKQIGRPWVISPFQCVHNLSRQLFTDQIAFWSSYLSTVKYTLSYCIMKAHAWEAKDHVLITV